MLIMGAKIMMQNVDIPAVPSWKDPIWEHVAAQFWITGNVGTQ